MTSKCLVVLSGGQDSTTCLAIAQNAFEEVHCLTFDYGQRHVIELESALAIGNLLGVASHETLTIGNVLKGTSPLVSNNPVGHYESAEALPGGIEPTFVPGRNLLFLTLAANRAACLGINDLFMGLCQADYGGYPDCEQPFVDLMTATLSQGIYGKPDQFRVHTPLMNLTKVESVNLAASVLGDRFQTVFQETHTCYDGVKGGCGTCHACLLRDKGFKEAGIDDPIWQYRGRQWIVEQGLLPV